MYTLEFTVGCGRRLHPLRTPSVPTADTIHVPAHDEGDLVMAIADPGTDQLDWSEHELLATHPIDVQRN